jgi:hypothetical protein
MSREEVTFVKTSRKSVANGEGSPMRTSLAISSYVGNNDVTGAKYDANGLAIVQASIASQIDSQLMSIKVDAKASNILNRHTIVLKNQ